jgi:hypothetical protein
VNHRITTQPEQSDRPVVMVDLDGVLADFVAEFKRRTEAELGHTMAEVSVWNFFSEQWGLTDEWYKDRMRQWTADGLFRWLPEHHGGVDAVRRLMDAELHVHFYTSRPDEAAADTLGWLGDRFDDDSDLWTVEVARGAKSGGHRFVAAIDDYIGNVHSLANTGCPFVVTCRRPWNSGEEHFERLTVAGFAEAVLEHMPVYV